MSRTRSVRCDIACQSVTLLVHTSVISTVKDGFDEGDYKNIAAIATAPCKCDVTAAKQLH